MKPRKGNKAMADLATRFVNLKTNDAVRQFIVEFDGDIRSFSLIGALTPEQRLENDVLVLVDTIQHLRSAWTGKTCDGLLDPDDRLQSILFGGGRVASFSGRLVTVDHGTLESEDVWANPAVELAPYSKSRNQVNFFFRFKRRDVLDEIAYAILVASRRGLLRMCKGSEHKDWNCQTPFLVADEGRRRYCYGACGENNQVELAREWHRTHPRKRRKLAA